MPILRLPGAKPASAEIPTSMRFAFTPQQAVEKLLKARLAASRRRIPRTHDLAQLLDAVVDLEPLWETWRTELNELVAFAVEFRYPGEAATKDMAKRALMNANAICKEIRLKLDETLR